MRRMLGACALLVSFGTGCGKTGNRLVEETPNTPSTGGKGGTSGTGGSAPLKPGEMAESCTVPGPSPGPSPLNALSNFELNRSVRALLGDGPQPSEAVWLGEDVYNEPFSSPQPVAMHTLAHGVALELSQDAKAVQALSGCDPLVSGNETCATSFIAEFLARAYRRPVTKEDEDEMRAVFAEGERLGGEFTGGVRAVVEVTLQSPDFLYLIETGNGNGANEAVQLTGYESVARLAYFLTAAPPDDQLRAAAAQGALSAETLEDEARRLLGSPASRELVRHYYAKLLRLGNAPENPELGFTAEIDALSQEETARFVEDVTFDGTGTFRALLTEPSTWVNEPLAKFYGLPGVAGAEFQKVALDPTQRGGLLTQVAFLRTASHNSETSPVYRGLAVLEKLLCYDMPPPPAILPVVAPADVSSKPTTRERLSVATQGPACQGCHRDINPPGFAFEHFDAVGKWRDTEQGVAIDSSGELYRTDAAGKFANAIELLQHVADSGDAKACFVGHWLTQAYRRAADPGDACAVEQVSQAFADSDGNVVELMVALAKSDNFRYRLKSELVP
jgi:Protein of unknown function (DUF1588)/Protein of unknown function (DUF1592)/Protein of unknown function (DUF1595)/Protein of unknown function (DUF1585)